MLGLTPVSPSDATSKAQNEQSGGHRRRGPSESQSPTGASGASHKTPRAPRVGAPALLLPR